MDYIDKNFTPLPLGDDILWIVSLIYPVLLILSDILIFIHNHSSIIWRFLLLFFYDCFVTMK